MSDSAMTPTMSVKPTTWQASGRCPHCLNHKTARSHFGYADAELNLARTFLICRAQRVRNGLSVADHVG